MLCIHVRHVPFFECNQAHVIVEQAISPLHISLLVTVWVDDRRGLGVSHVAFSTTPMQNSRSIIRLVELTDECDMRTCSVRWRDFPFAMFDFEEVDNAANIIVKVAPAHAPATDEVAFMQRDTRQNTQGRRHSGGQRGGRSHHGGFCLNADAAPFIPDRPSIDTQPEFVQALFGLWDHAAFAWENEDRSGLVHTFFVDHTDVIPICSPGRLVRLFSDFANWQQRLKQAWSEKVRDGQTLEFLIVSPTPRPMEHEVMACVLLVQSPGVDIVSVVVSVFEGEVRPLPLRARIAVTIWENIYLEHILTSIGYFDAVLGMRPTHQCWAWYGDIPLRWGQPLPGRNGYGIVVQLRRLPPLPPPVAAGDEVVTLQLARLIPPHSQDASSDAISADEQLHTSAVRLLRGHAEVTPLPDYVEVLAPLDECSIEAELRHWGHQCQVVLCQPHDVAVCFPQDGVPSLDRVHFIYVNQDVTDSAGVILHSSESLMQELCHMRFLHQLGYEKAVILKERVCLPGLTVVDFQESVGILHKKQLRSRPLKAWPPARQPVTSITEIFAPTQQQLTNPTCLLRLGVELHDLVELFQSSGTLCTSFEGIEIPEVAQPFLVTLQPAQKYDRIIIYVDGSSQSLQKHCAPLWVDLHGIPDSWAFVAIGETYDVPSDQAFCLLGWQAQQVRYEESNPAFAGATRIGSLIAEREGLFFAALWRLCRNENTATLFRSDSQLCCEQAQGTTGCADLDLSFMLFRGVFQALEEALPHGHLQVEHVHGHNGDALNEVTDTLAKIEGTKSFFLPRQPVDLCKWKSVIPHLWLLFAEHHGGPKFCGNGFDVARPSLPPLQSIADAGGNSLVSHTWHRAAWKLSLASANVTTLGFGEGGYQGKLDFLRAQFVAFNLHILGIREARSQEGTTIVGNVLRLCSGSAGGHFGVELWCNLNQPVCFVKGAPLFFQAGDFQVLHRDPRRLLVRTTFQDETFLFLVCHAPQSGVSLAERSEWWAQTTEVLQRLGREDHIFLMADVNAGPGEADGVTVFEKGFRTSSGTPLLRQFLDEHSLCLPSTASFHAGPKHTWICPDGSQEFCIDFVAIPRAFFSSCTWSQTIEDFDLGQQQIDHLAVGVELQWDHWTSSASRLNNGVSFDRHRIRSSLESISLMNHKLAPWSTDVESHLHDLNAHFLSQLQSCRAQKKRHKKPFLSDDIWALRSRKLCHRRQLRFVQKMIGRETISLCFRAWKNEHFQTSDGPSTAEFSFGATLRCGGIKHAAGLISAARQLRKELRFAKRVALTKVFDSFPDNVSASTILHELKPFIGSSNAKKRGIQPLPFVRDENGLPCADPCEARERWIRFFMQMEAGKRMDAIEQRSRWIQTLGQIGVEQMDVAIQEVPTLTELEQAMRRTRVGKATGPDQLPAELFHYFPAAVAKQSFSLLLKTALQGHEPLLHKGGWLFPLWKGKGDKGACESFRSILISSHLGKSIHRTLRIKHASVYEKYMQAQQIGGRRGTPVTLGVHQARAFQRIHCARGRSTALIFLDLTKAFYRVIRQLALPLECPDELLAHVADRLNLGQDALHELHELLGSSCAVEEASLPVHAQRAFSALHQGTHFGLHGQSDRCVTALGSRPGDAFADVIFGFLWAKVLHQFQTQMEVLGMLEKIPSQDGPLLFDVLHGVDTGNIGFVGPCWCDDLCVCVSADRVDDLTALTGAATGLLLDLCAQHGMTPNLNKGKTEIVFSARGPGSRTFKKQIFGPQANGLLPVLGEHQVHQVSVVGHYVHLGGELHHSGDLRVEVRRKIAVAHQTFTKFRKLLLQNPNLSLAKWVEIFRSLVLSKFLYGVESWVLHGQRIKSYVHASLIRLYKRLLRIRPAEHISDEEVLVKTGLPSPSELLRLARLRYLSSLVAAGSATCWGLFNLDTDWVALLQDDLQWVFRQLQNASHLQDPCSHFAQWLDLIGWHRQYWKRIIRRASQHAILQRGLHHRVLGFHLHALEVLERGGVAVPQPFDQDDLGETAFGCMKCGKVCKNKAGEGSHMHKVHGYVHPVRHLFQGTQCAICLREYFTFAKLQQHLRCVEACRTQWLGRFCGSTPVPGIGSCANRDLEQAHDRLLPPLQALGPSLPPGRERDFDSTNWQLFADLSLILYDTPGACSLEAELRDHIQSRAISWSTCLCTLTALLEHLEDAFDEFGVRSKHEVVDVVKKLTRVSSWDFLNVAQRHVNTRFASLDALTSSLDVLECAAFEKIPRIWGRHRVILHAFAGRRRPGDFQYYLDQLCVHLPDDVVIHTASMDILYDVHLGDASAAEAQAYWLHGITQRFVVGFLGGPPCETWSVARAVQLLQGIKGPRPVRDATDLWGHASLALKELLQVCVGNDLLTFTLICIMYLALYDGVAVMEHPAQPSSEQAASVWKLPIMQVILSLPGFELLTLCQGVLGAATPKPTLLLTLNLPELQGILHQHRVTRELPRRAAIGKTSDGGWATTSLKEYPPAFCKGLASAFYSAIQTPLDVEHSACPDDFLSKCAHLFVQKFSCHLGQDYAG